MTNHKYNKIKIVSWCIVMCVIFSLSLSFSLEAFVISFTSDFIPRLVYQYMFSQTGTMHGFIDHTLSYFNVSNFKPGTAPQNSDHGNITVCR